MRNDVVYREIDVEGRIKARNRDYVNEGLKKSFNQDLKKELSGSSFGWIDGEGRNRKTYTINRSITVRK